MRVLDVSTQHGHGMSVYSGYGFGKSMRKMARNTGKAFKSLAPHAKKIGSNIARNTAENIIDQGLQGKFDPKMALANASKKEALSQGKKASRPYLN